MSDDWDPERELRRAHAQIHGYRELLVRVAEGLERLAAELPAAAPRLREAAMWLRRTVWRGAPPPEARGRLGVGAGPADDAGAPSDADR